MVQATGEAWHHAPMAARLAQGGVVTVVMQYTLYPEALAPTMVQEVNQASWHLCYLLTCQFKESVTLHFRDGAGVLVIPPGVVCFSCKCVSLPTGTSTRSIEQPHLRILPVFCTLLQALDWVLSNAAAIGGDPGQVSLAGHSAGGQLCSMALLHRALDGCKAMPARLVTLAAVFDIAKHLEYEQTRNVHELSTMARAIGGPDNFARSSPAAILSAALSRAGGGGSHVPAAQHAPFYQSFPLRGAAVAQRIGLSRSVREPSPATRAVPARPLPAAAPAQPPSPSESDIMQFSVAHAQRLPPTVLLSSCMDAVVPWHESSEMFWALHDCGAPAKSLVYNSVQHGDFVTAWKPVPELHAAVHVNTGGDLPDFAADLMSIVSGRVEVDYT